MPLPSSSPCFLLRVQLLVSCCSFKGNAPFIRWLFLRFPALDFLQLGFDVLRRGFYVNYTAWADNLSSILSNSWLVSLQTVPSCVLSLLSWRIPSMWMPELSNNRAQLCSSSGPFHSSRGLINRAPPPVRRL